MAVELSKAFETPPSGRVRRRALLIAPIVLAGFYTLVRQPERELPDPAAGGDGPPARLILFSSGGERESAVNVRRIVKTDSEWRAELTGNEYAVARRKSTEFAFTNAYWNNHDAGIYRCVCCGNALFRSEAKFDSGTGWPSFAHPIAEENVYNAIDTSLAEKRTEVLCRKCDAHLGHRFDDGPPPRGWRYCVNSTAMHFVKYS